MPKLKSIPRYLPDFEPGWLLGRSLPILEHEQDYSRIKFRARWIRLTPKQTIIVRLLDEARLARQPLLNGKALLNAIGNHPDSNLRDAFQRTGLLGKDKLIAYAGAGDYFLNI